MKQRSLILLRVICAALIFLNVADAQSVKSRTKRVASKAAIVSSRADDNLLPRKVDDQTAISPIYRISSKNCRNRDFRASGGEDFYRECKGYGNYLLLMIGSDSRVNHGIVTKNTQSGFLVMFFPLGEGAAAKYERADLYDEKLANEIEWRLDERSVPFAVIVRAAFYKNMGRAKTFSNPKNKIAEFYFVRGLAGDEDLKEDVPTANTPYNPLEQVRAIAAEYLEKHRSKN